MRTFDKFCHVNCLCYNKMAYHTKRVARLSVNVCFLAVPIFQRISVICALVWHAKKLYAFLLCWYTDEFRGDYPRKISEDISASLASQACFVLLKNGTPCHIFSRLFVPSLRLNRSEMSASSNRLKNLIITIYSYALFIIRQISF